MIIYVCIFCTIINITIMFCVLGKAHYVEKAFTLRKRNIELCRMSIINNVCPHECGVCAYGEPMTLRQIKHEKEIKEFYKEIKRYHRRHKHD